MRRTVFARAVLGALAVALGAGGAPQEVHSEPSSPQPSAEAAAPADPFPVPESLRENVEFWKQVFCIWGLGQAVLHDADRPSLVYAIVEVPGGATETYSRTQRDFVRARERDLEARLKELERKAAAGAPLDETEKALALRITTTVGVDALRGAADRVRSQRGLRERFRRGLEISGRYDAAFREIFREAAVPEDLAFLPHVESSFQSSARSSAGAVGVWQFTRHAARKFMTLTPALDERLDPVASARGAARYLRSAFETLGDWALAVTSYNHGVEGMQRAKATFGLDIGRIVREYDGPLFGFASRNFYAEFLAAREIAKDPSRFFPEGIAPEPPLSLDRIVLDRSRTVRSIAREVGVRADALAALNPGWTRRAVRADASLPAGTAVWLPQGTLARLAGGRTPRGAAAPPPAAVPALPDPPGPPGIGPPTAESHLAEFVVHVVRHGETLFKIATRYGVKVSDILGANPIGEHSILRPGMRLRIPVLR